MRKWLQLRLHAWLRGRSVELVQVTPNYLQQIDASHCPITRVPLANPTQDTSDASIDRVRNDAGYAAGNLATISRAAAAQYDGISGIDHFYPMVRSRHQIDRIAREIEQAPGI